MKVSSLRDALVVLVAVHSLVIGIGLIIAPLEIFGAFGWSPDCNGFFFHQVGVFHIVLAAIYLIEYFRFNGISTILVAKFSAAAFLAVEYATATQQIPILLAGLGDLAIALLVAAVFRFQPKA